MRNSVSTMVGILTAAVLVTTGAASAVASDEGLSALSATARSAVLGGSDTGEGPNVIAAPSDTGEGPNVIAAPSDTGEGPNRTTTPTDTGEGPNVAPASVGEGPNAV
ncbi:MULTISPECIES: hypothetical protein [unclassified Streptomyces]|uniref:hypothetical protein n=1 Tax=unclassified Streptomyces TaxID=2593676 RepID=UPI0024A9EB52|nr:MULTISPECIES: hypothetical protein [unclassified Streptomyces]